MGGWGVERWHWKQNNGCSNYFGLYLLNNSVSLFAICCEALWQLDKHDASTAAACQRKKNKSIPGQRSPQWRTQDQLIALQTRADWGHPKVDASPQPASFKHLTLCFLFSDSPQAARLMRGLVLMFCLMSGLILHYVTAVRVKAIKNLN